jgi:phospholipase C
MTQIDRRGLLAAIGALALPPALARAAAIDADVRTPFSVPK